MGLTLGVPPEALLDRHCAVVGSTGGGKSWTTSRLVEEIGNAGGKVLLLDPTGEYRPPPALTTSVRLGEADAGTSVEATNVTLPHWMLANDDLFALFTPAGQMQGPLLREAIRSLRLVEAMGDSIPNGLTVDEGTLVKQDKRRRPWVDAVREHQAVVEASRGSYFDVTKLTAQLKHECVWQTGRDDAHSWGGRDDKALSYVVPLVLRIESFLEDSRFACVFRASQDLATLVDSLERFMSDPGQRVLHVDLSTVPIERHFRQIVVNALSRLLLDRSRRGVSKSAPLVLVVDEAHHFLGRVAHLEEFGLALDGIELIAKEGRKYGLHLILATQRPRDLTRAVLSQIGSVFVHRLTETEDLEILSHTAGRRDTGSTAYVPTLAPGECLLFGASIPFPMIIKVMAPAFPPVSSGSRFAELWTDRGDGQRPT